MIFNVTFKDPDAIYDALQDAVDEELAASGLDEEEQEAVKELRLEKYNNLAGKWIKWGEYIEIQFDTEAGTAVVVEPTDD